ncbi:MAG: AAA family ATPase [Candidatus Coproplasma sp.]
MSKNLLKWQDEIELYADFRTTFIMEGEIFDKQPTAEDGEFMLVSLDQYLHDKLTSMGYECIVFFNHVDGFYNNIHHKDRDPIKDFQKIIKNVQKDTSDSTIQLNTEARNSKFGDATEKIRLAMRNNDSQPIAIICNMASRYITNATHLAQDEQYFYSELFLASQTVANPMSSTANKKLNNLIFILCDKTNDIPAWFYLNNPMVKTLQITVPNAKTRELYLDAYFDCIEGGEEVLKYELDKVKKIKRKFVDLTSGFRNRDLDALRRLMKNEKISIEDVGKAVSLYKYGTRDNPWDDPVLIEEKLGTLTESLKKRVKGQDVVIQQVSDIMTRAIFGLSGITHSSSSSKPKGIMFFAGPTGTGKTELAKTLAEWLFGTEDACIRFDMSEYSLSHSDQKLLGAPPGYVGYEEGGQLTNAVKQHPFSILLFDEIEKADRSILDKFLQILEDGRMTDGKGETVYFSDTIIIFTSNLGITKTNRLTGEKLERITYNGEQIIDCESKKFIENYDDYKAKIMEGVDDFFLHEAGRPELKNRIGDNFIVYEFIKPEVANMIADTQLQKIKANLLQQKNITLNYKKVLPALYVKLAKYLPQGGRGVGNAIEKYIVNPLARFLGENRRSGNCTVEITGIKEENGIITLECTLQ